MQYKTKKIKDSILLISEYNPIVTDICLSIGAKWNRQHLGWLFKDEDSAKEVINECFGLSDEVVEVDIDSSKWKDGKLITVGGYVLASREFQDHKAILGPGVKLKSGSLPSSGGLPGLPMVNPSQDSVFTIKMHIDFAQRHGLL